MADGRGLRSALFAAALFAAAPVAAEDAKPAPALADIESWTCGVRADIDDHFSAYLEAVVTNPAAKDGARELQDVHRPHFYVNWQAQPGHISEMQVSWGPLDPTAAELGAAKEVGFEVPGPRLRSGWIELASEGADSLVLPVNQQRLEWLAPTFLFHWVRLTDPAEIATITKATGWRTRFLENGKAHELGDPHLPDWAAARAAYATLRIELQDDMAHAKDRCRPNVIDYDALLESVI